MESIKHGDSQTDPSPADSTPVLRIPNDTVFVVEDSKPMSAVVKTMIRSLGFNVIDFPDGAAARQFIEQSSNLDLLNVVLIFSDYMMPSLDGLSLLKFTRSHTVLGPVAFVIATAAATPDLVTEAKALGVSGLFVKPISHKRLVELLKKIFPGRKLPEIKPQ